MWRGVAPSLPGQVVAQGRAAGLHGQEFGLREPVEEGGVVGRAVRVGADDPVVGVIVRVRGHHLRGGAEYSGQSGRQHKPLQSHKLYTSSKLAT